jgi:hypothetical protein
VSNQHDGCRPRGQLTHDTRILDQAAAEAERLRSESDVAPAATWRALARSIGRFPGDATVVYLLGHQGGSLRAAALHHPDAAARRLMLDILALGPHTLVDAFTLRVLQTGQSLRVPVHSEELFRLWVQPEFTAYLDAYSVHSLMVVPLRVGGRLLGALRVWRERADAWFRHEDEVYVQAVVDHITDGLVKDGRARRAAAGKAALGWPSRDPA